MASEPDFDPSAAQRRASEHRGGPLLVVGPGGSGRTETLVRRLAHLADHGVAPERVVVLTRSRAAAARLRTRAQASLTGSFEELWIDTYAALAERLLREHAIEAGLDPFFETVGAADRLAMLLDRVSDLPLRRHEIRGNPAGLLARLLGRIDTLKDEAVGAPALRRWAAEREREASSEGDREAARRELEFADLYERHDRILGEAGSLDQGDLVLALGRLLRDRADVRDRLGARFAEVMADEYEDAGAAHRQLLEGLASHGGLLVACDDRQAIRRFRGAGASAAALFRARHPGCEDVSLEEPRRGGGEIALSAAAVAGEEPGPAGEGDAIVRFWRSRNRGAEAQAAAREIEHLLATEEVRPEQVCVIVEEAQREGRLVAAALEERSVPFRLAGGAAFFQRPEVRDAIAWLRVLADPNDSPAAVRALTRPPIELRSVDLARCTLIARRRKLDMISAVEAACESPQLPPEARDRIQAFLKLYRAAGAALEEMRADVFVRRLIERIGLRRHQLFAASPETAYRLVSLSRLADLAAAWARREPRASTRDFVRYLTAVAEAGELGDDPLAEPPRAGVLLAEPEQVKGLEFDHVYVLDLHRDALSRRHAHDGWIPEELLAEEVPPAGDELSAAHRARLAYVAMTRASRSLVLGWPEETSRGPTRPSPVYEAARAAVGGEEEIHEEELFGPAEGLHATYRMVRDEVLETSWRAGGALSEMRLDTAGDVDRAVARFLELVKLAALIQRPGDEPAADALAALNQLVVQAATPEQRAMLEDSVLDEYLVEEERERRRRRELIAERHEPSLEAFIPKRGEGLALSASDLDLYRICPLKYKFARVFAIPEEPTINQRFGILIHQVLQRFHADELREEQGHHEAGTEEGRREGIDRLLWLFEAGWRRAGFGASDDELQYRDRAVAALTRYWERHLRSETTPVWLERAFAFGIGPHQLRGRIDRIDRLPDGGYELIDYKTGTPASAPQLASDLQLALYRVGAREAWRIDADAGSYWYVLEDEKVPVPSAPDDRERVERTVIDVAEGINGQDFEPRPSYEICSWCDYRLICPASEA
ncbi:MAG: ATP-dependent helicase [Solirubrobacterales bacterium]